MMVEHIWNTKECLILDNVCFFSSETEKHMKKIFLNCLYVKYGEGTWNLELI